MKLAGDLVNIFRDLDYLFLDAGYSLDGFRQGLFFIVHVQFQLSEINGKNRKALGQVIMKLPGQPAQLLLFDRDQPAGKFLQIFLAVPESCFIFPE